MIFIDNREILFMFLQFKKRYPMKYRYSTVPVSRPESREESKMP